jgi:hypothetical protein
MKNSIVIGPIQKAKRTDSRHRILKDRLTKMQLGNYFEISGISGKQEATNIRAALSYISKRENVKIATVLTGSTLRVERVKKGRIETKTTNEVQK